MTIFKDKSQEADLLLRIHATAFCKNFFNSGGTLDLWTEIGTAVAAEMGKSGPHAVVQQDQSNDADLSRPIPSEGQPGIVQQDHIPSASARYPIFGIDNFRMPEGHAQTVQQDHMKNADGLPIAGEAKDVAPQGQNVAASTRDPIPSGGQNNSVQQDQKRRANAGKPIASDWGRGSRAKQGQQLVAPVAREPSAADIEALKDAGDFHYFQMINLRKKAWSTYRYKDLRNVRSLNMQENLIIQDVIQWGRDHRTKEDDLVSLTMPAKEMKEIVRLARSAIPSKADMTVKRSARRAR